MHGLRGGWGNSSAAQTPRPLTGVDDRQPPRVRHALSWSGKLATAAPCHWRPTGWRGDEGEITGAVQVGHRECEGSPYRRISDVDRTDGLSAATEY